jgi:hypothetical protein
MIKFFLNIYILLVTCISAQTVGGYIEDCLNGYSKSLLYHTMNCDINNKTPICISNFISLHTQVVNGINYKYEVTGCKVSNIQDTLPDCISNCTYDYIYNIIIYIQPWNNIYNITSIEQVN